MYSFDLGLSVGFSPQIFIVLGSFCYTRPNICMPDTVLGLGNDKCPTL